MKIQYLGTAAAEGIPALFCQCKLCKKARELRGKELRGRTGAVIDDTFMIDFPPDMLSFANALNLDLAKIKHLVVTHSHTDHFAPADLVLRQPGCYCHLTDGEPVLHVYGNSEVLRLTTQALITEYRTDTVDFIKAHRLYAFEETCIGGFMVTPLPAVHKPDEDAYIYLVQKQDRAMLYAHDTGIFPQSVFQYLEGKPLDFVSLDCTCCMQKDGRNHMGLPDNALVLEKLRAIGAVTDRTIGVINHFSHNGLLTHAQLEKEAEKYGLIAAYDGMVVDLPYGKNG